MRDSWSEATLGDLCRTVTERRDSKEVPGIRYVGLEHMPSDAPEVQRHGTTVGLASQVVAFQPRDVLFGRLRPYLRKVALADFAGVCSPEILVLRSTHPRVLPGYLYALAAGEAAIAHAVAASAGSRMPRTSSADFLALPVLVPPLAEQRRIVDLIGALDDELAATRRLRQESVRTADALREHHFADCDVETVPLVWLAHEAGIQMGPFGSQLHASDYVTSGIPVVMPQDMVAGRISSRTIARVSEEDARRLGRHRLQPGDILFSRRGNLSKRALVGPEHEGWLCGTGSLRVRPVEDSADVVFQAVRTQEVDDWLNANAVGATMPNLNTAIVARLPVRIPQRGRIAAAAVSSAEALARRAGVTAKAVARARTAFLASLLSGQHAIPSSYDRFLEPPAA